MRVKKQYKKVYAAVLICLVVGIAGCAPTGNSRSEKNSTQGSEQTSMAFQWTSDSDCSMCHTKETDSLTDTIYEISASHSDIACVECHRDVDALQTAHAEVTAEETDVVVRVLKKTEITQDSCSTCHSIEGLAALTADADVLTDSKGTVVNPHELPTVGTHGDISCGQCHNMHSAGSPLTDAPEYCLSCHHSGAYECNTCHEA